jgi:hypothetical protein
MTQFFELISFKPKKPCHLDRSRPALSDGGVERPAFPLFYFLQLKLAATFVSPLPSHFAFSG